MTIEELKDLLSRTTYKPGSSIWLQIEGRTVLLIFGLSVPDVEKSQMENVPQNGVRATVGEPGPMIHISATKAIHMRGLELMDEKQLLELIKCVWHFMEAHEVDEWLKLDGEPVTEPHPELRAEALSRDPNCQL